VALAGIHLPCPLTQVPDHGSGSFLPAASIIFSRIAIPHLRSGATTFLEARPCGSTYVHSYYYSCLQLCRCPCLYLRKQKRRIAGTAQDSAGSALIGARVVVQPTGRETASDNQGNFRISDSAAGQYTITALTSASPLTPPRSRSLRDRQQT